MIEMILSVVALILAAVDQFQAQGRSLLAWAVIALAAIHVLSYLA